MILVRPLEDPLLDRVDEVVELGQEREEAVHEHVDDVVEHLGRLPEHARVEGVTLPALAEGGARDRDAA